ncbi:MAG TPA: FkbM family methyltransferase [Acetobacteraceae bacterium]|nr:FkbM family methyltransferase [Acetobacteraceae bacterium]
MKVLWQSRPDRQSHGFRVTSHPVAEAAARTFGRGRHAGMLRLLDAVLPHCRRMVEFGAYIGLNALYAATWCREVFAFEPSPTNHELLACNVAANPELAPRIRLFRHGIGQDDGYVPLYAKGLADAGTSVFREVERADVVCARQHAIVPLRDAGAVLRELGLDDRTLLHIDVAGAEYTIVPQIAELLAERKPWLLVAFHPFNLVAGRDPYRTALLRLRCGMEAAEALAAYRFIHLYEADTGWRTVGPAERMDFLRQYLLSAKPVPRIASSQYGFVHTLAFSDQPLPADEREGQAAPQPTR